MSRQAKPKQFLKVLSDHSLIRGTADRLQGLVPIERTLVVTNQAYVDLTQEHLPGIPDENVLAEPVARNTAPAIALAAARLYARDPDAAMVVLPADHLIRNVSAFHEVLGAAAEQAERGSLVTIGITPTHPETGYGYIQYDADPDAGDAPLPAPVRAFAEKPDVATAERFLDAGDFLWNSGMFIWRADAILEALKTHLPGVYRAFEPLAEGDASSEALKHAFDRTPKISIDYGVMEPAAAAGQVYVVPGSFGWSDVGDWRAVYDLATKDSNGNAVEGDAVLHQSARSMVHAPGGDRVVVLVGVQDLAVVDTGDALLVCKLDQTQQVKTVVDYLGSSGIQRLL